VLQGGPPGGGEAVPADRALVRREGGLQRRDRAWGEQPVEVDGGQGLPQGGEGKGALVRDQGC